MKTIFILASRAKVLVRLELEPLLSSPISMVTWLAYQPINDLQMLVFEICNAAGDGT